MIERLHTHPNHQAASLFGATTAFTAGLTVKAIRLEGVKTLGSGLFHSLRYSGGLIQQAASSLASLSSEELLVYKESAIQTVKSLTAEQALTAFKMGGNATLSALSKGVELAGRFDAIKTGDIAIGVGATLALATIAHHCFKKATANQEAPIRQKVRSFGNQLGIRKVAAIGLSGVAGALNQPQLGGLCVCYAMGLFDTLGR